MPITQLDEHSALIVVDLQKGIVAMPTAESAADVARQAGRRLPDPLPPGWSDFAPELHQQSSDHVVMSGISTSADAHANSAIRIFPRIGETGSTAAVLAELDRRLADK